MLLSRAIDIYAQCSLVIDNTIAGIVAPRRNVRSSMSTVVHRGSKRRHYTLAYNYAKY